MLVKLFLCGGLTIVSAVVPVLLHGFYDFCLSVDSDLFIGIFLLFEVIITVKAIKKVRTLSRDNVPLER
ncbi:MAG: hypothetical protein IJV50_06205 [Lachnospiraceae bacterium]|nr:hypothetical protein [Lachnospiraceae bacterium]